MRHQPLHLTRLRTLVVLSCLLASTANAFLLAPSYSDLYPLWNGTRAFLLNRTSPYADSVTEQNKERFRRSTGEHPLDAQRFSYPLPATFLLAPFACLAFPSAQVLMTILGTSLTLLSTYWWTEAFQMERALLVLAAYPVMLGLEIQQATTLFAALLAAAARCGGNGLHSPGRSWRSPFVSRSWPYAWARRPLAGCSSVAHAGGGFSPPSPQPS